MMSSRAWVRPTLAVAYVAAITLTLAYFMVRIPIQLTDGASNMIDVVGKPLLTVFRDKAGNDGFFRPLMWPPYGLVMTWSGGHYHAWFKTLQVGQLFVLLLLWLRWVRVGTRLDLAVLPIGVAVLTGSHMFVGAIREAFPINHFLAIAGASLAAAVLSLERRRVINDVLAMALFAYASLTLETGLLVWVILIWGFVLGGRGVSRWGLAAVTAGLVAYLAVRFLWLGTGSPGLDERATGFGFRVLEPAELIQRFGAHPVWLYAYNVAGGLGSVLFAEPRGGVFRFVRGLVTGESEPRTVVNVLCATGTTLLAATSLWRVLRRGRRAPLTHADQVLLMFPAVLAANAVFCYGYLKDVVLSPAGVFFAGAAFVAFREALSAILQPRPGASRVARAGLAVLVTVLAAGWGIKQIGVHYAVRKQIDDVRTEWTQVDRWLAAQEIALDTPEKRALKETLERAALTAAPAPSWPVFPWPRSWFDEDQ